MLVESEGKKVTEREGKNIENRLGVKAWGRRDSG